MSEFVIAQANADSEARGATRYRYATTFHLIGFKFSFSYGSIWVSAIHMLQRYAFDAARRH